MPAQQQPAAEELPPRDHNNPPSIFQVLSDSTQTLASEIEALATRANDGPRVIAGEDDLGKVGKLVTDARALRRKIELRRVSEKQPFLDGGYAVDEFFKQFATRVDRVQSTFQKLGDRYQAAKDEEARRAAAELARKAREEEQRRIEAARKAEDANRQKHAQQHQARAGEAAAQATEAETVLAARPADLTRVTTSSGVTASAKGEWTHEIEDLDKIDLEALRAFIAVPDLEKAIRAFVRSGRRQLAGVRIFEKVTASFRS